MCELQMAWNIISMFYFILFIFLQSIASSILKRNVDVSLLCSDLHHIGRSESLKTIDFSSQYLFYGKKSKKAAYLCDIMLLLLELA